VFEVAYGFGHEDDGARPQRGGPEQGPVRVGRLARQQGFDAGGNPGGPEREGRDWVGGGGASGPDERTCDGTSSAELISGFFVGPPFHAEADPGTQRDEDGADGGTEVYYGLIEVVVEAEMGSFVGQKYASVAGIKGAQHGGTHDDAGWASGKSEGHRRRGVDHHQFRIGTTALQLSSLAGSPGFTAGSQDHADGGERESRKSQTLNAVRYWGPDAQ